jgi:probable rRNA maturation factor
MTFLIEVQNEGSGDIDTVRLQQAATATLKRHEVDPDSSVSIVITSNEAVQALNKQHRNVDAPTDVLSFPADDLPEEIEGEAPYLGDLLIAYPYAKAQAEREQHPLSDSLTLLVVHGTLHLLGYDHDSPANRAEMWAVQAEVLRELGIDVAIVPALEGDAAHDETDL